MGRERTKKLPQDLDQGFEVGEGAGTRATEDLRVAPDLRAPEKWEGHNGHGYCSWRDGYASGKEAAWEEADTEAAAIADDTTSLERLYARALDRIGTLEATLTAAQARNGELLEEVRYLRSEFGRRTILAIREDE
jgi:hypothetical protein